MLIYWLLFLVPACLALHYSKPCYNRELNSSLTLPWLTALLVFSLIIGFRHEVGADWPTYLLQFERIGSLTFFEALLQSDPFYAVLNWLSSSVGGDIYLVNLFCGFIFMWGVVKFCQTLPRSWLAFSIAVPFLILVVGMGYTRQAAALGLIIIGLTHQENGRYLKNIFFIILACLFHKTALVMFVFALRRHNSNGKKSLEIFLVVLIVIISYFFVLSDSIALLYKYYVVVEYRSSGAEVRALMNFLPAIAFLFLRNRLAISADSKFLWTRISIATVILSTLVPFAPGQSTMLDRFGVYLMPIQLYVLSRIPDVLGSFGKRNLLWVLILLFYSALILFVWFNFAIHAHGWVPYKFFLFG